MIFTKNQTSKSFFITLALIAALWLSAMPAYAQPVPPPTPPTSSNPQFQIPNSELRIPDAGAATPPPVASPGDSATETSCTSGLDVPCGFFKALNWIADALLEGPMNLGREAVTGAIAFNQKLSGAGQIDFVRIGWPIIRDLANLFFVFILLWIALATIFDFDKYSAKTILPRFIIIALLINFSLVIGTFVISLSNSLGNVYFSQVNTLSGLLRIVAPAQQIVKETETPDKNIVPAATAAAKKDQLEKLWNTSNIVVKWNKFRTIGGFSVGKEPKPEQKTIQGKPNCEDLRAEGKLPSGSDEEDLDFKAAIADACAKAAGNLWDASAFMAINTRDGPAKILAKQFLLKIIIYPAIIFVLFAVAILLLVRYVSLLFLLVLGPLAFLSHILPGTERYWSDWWSKLIKWSLFFPVFSILFYISIKTLDELNKVAGGADIVSYLLTIFFIIGSLLAAQELGIAGANMTMGYGKKLAKGAGALAMRGTTAPIRFAGNKIKEKGGQALDKQLSKLQSTRFGQTLGVDKLIAKTRTGLSGLEGSEFKRKHGLAMQGSDESVVKYAASVAQHNPQDAAKILEKMGAGKLKSGMGKISAGGQTALGTSLKKIGMDHLVRNVSNNPETLTDLTQPGFADEVLKQEARSRNPNLSAAEVGQAKAALEVAKTNRDQAIKQQFRMMDKSNVSAEYIKTLKPTDIKELNSKDVQGLASTPAGAKAFHQARENAKTKHYDQIIEKAGLEATPLETVNRELVQKISEIENKIRTAAPGVNIYDLENELKAVENQRQQAIEQRNLIYAKAHQEAQRAIDNLEYLSKETATYINSSPGRPLLYGGVIKRKKTPEEKLALAMRELEANEGPANPSAPPPPPPRT